MSSVPIDQVLTVGYSWPIVLLSFLIAGASSYTALELTAPAAAAAAESRRSILWTVASTAALAIGVWSMHFVGMQAFCIDRPIEYDLPLVVTSFIVAIFGAAVALWLVMRNGATHRTVIGASILLGLFLASMHYTGMAALRIAAIVRYDPFWVLMSVAIAGATSYAAFRLIGEFTARQQLRHFRSKVLTACVLGLAIISVHYTGMHAATFYGRAMPGDAGPDLISQTMLAWSVSAATVIVLSLFLMSAAFSRRNRARQREEQRYRDLAESVPNMMWTFTRAGELDYCNARVTEYTGISMEQLVKEGWMRIVHPSDANDVRQAWERAFRTGTPFRGECRLGNAAGEYRWHVALASPLQDERGAIVKWIGSGTDVHDRKISDANGQLIAAVTRELMAAQDPTVVLDRFCKLMTERESALACVHVQSDDGNWLQLAKSAREPARVRGVESFHLFLHEQILAVHERKESIATTEMPTKLLELGFSSLVSVPMELGDAPAVFTVGSIESSRVFSKSDVAFLCDLASRASVAHRNAVSFERERHVSDMLQRALLPQELPSLDGLRLSATYEPGLHDMHVGGDWYDALRLDSHRMMLSIGDVTGRGLQAAVIMSKVRQTIEALGLYESDPSKLLDDADSVLKRTFPEAIVTACVGIFDIERATFSYATAGHPAPQLIAAGTGAITLPCSGLPLGLRGRHEPATVEISLPERSAIVLYTDGLTETRRDVIEGEHRLKETISRLFDEARLSAHELRSEMLAEGERNDDTAVLIVDGQPSRPPALAPYSLRWIFSSEDMSKGQEIRRMLRGYLTTRLPMSAEELEHAEILFGEMLGNVVKHAPGIAEVILEMTSPPVVHVIDSGGGFVPMTPEIDMWQESGRGMSLIKKLCSDMAVRTDSDGRTHVSAFLRCSIDNREAARRLQSVLS